VTARAARGFTLLELLVVLAIIALLVALSASPVLNRVNDRAADVFLMSFARELSHIPFSLSQDEECIVRIHETRYVLYRADDLLNPVSSRNWPKCIRLNTSFKYAAKMEVRFSALGQPFAYWQEDRKVKVLDFPVRIPFLTVSGAERFVIIESNGLISYR